MAWSYYNTFQCVRCASPKYLTPKKKTMCLMYEHTRFLVYTLKQNSATSIPEATSVFYSAETTDISFRSAVISYSTDLYRHRIAGWLVCTPILYSKDPCFYYQSKGQLVVGFHSVDKVLMQMGKHLKTVHNKFLPDLSAFHIKKHKSFVPVSS